MSDLVSIEVIVGKILSIRKQKVMVDKDLAELYDVQTKVLLQVVKRNIKRFPEDFMFQLTREENNALRSQFVTLEKSGRGKHRKYLPYVFTEQGVAMLSSALNSERAIMVNIRIMRIFSKLKQLALSHSELLRKVELLERKFGEHDNKIALIFEALKQLLEPPPKKTGKIGF